jgi:diguanylate cyclase (GGDEF)-like protein/PAS domain S-box-containing protein
MSGFGLETKIMTRQRTRSGRSSTSRRFTAGRRRKRPVAALAGADRDWAFKLLETAPSLICLCHKGTVTYLNETGRRWLGLKSARSAVGRPFTEFVQKPDRRAVAAKINGRTPAGSPLSAWLGHGMHRTLFAEICLRRFDPADRASLLIQAYDMTRQRKTDAALEKTREDLERRLLAEVTARRRVEENLNLAAQVISNLGEGVMILDRRRRVRSVNPAFTRITGFTSRSVMGKPAPFSGEGGKKKGRAGIRDARRMEDALQTKEIWKTVEREGRWEGEYWSKNKKGNDYAERLSITVINDDDGNILHYAAVISDITRRKADEERILYQANYDPLTGLPNRSLFMDRLNRALAIGTRARTKIGLMFIDLDGFKLVNDTLGHDVGDLLLKETSRRLNQSVRISDTVARLGGDEFTVLMPNLSDPSHIPVVAQRILDSLAATFHLKGHEAFVSASIGITIFPDDATEANDLLKNADTAMYRAKDLGKANYQFYTEELNRELIERMTIKNGLVKALDNQELQLYYQPKLSLENGRITGVEALMRWHSAELGLVLPSRFIPVLEDSGLVVEAGEWAIRTACRQLRNWREAGLPPLRVAVNLSTRQLRELSFVSVVADVLKETAVDGDLEIEITESLLIGNVGNLMASLQKLHDLRVHVTLDDFGTGYSSLSHLRHYPIDTIKIDGSFVADITESRADAEIIHTIINMGKTLNRTVVAENVETEEQVKLLREYGCNEIQGYYVCKPLPAADLTEFLKKRM